MNVDLGQLNDGRLALVTDTTPPAPLRRIEYYREQKLFMFIYDLPDHEGDLMHYELPDLAAREVERAGEMVFIVNDKAHGGQTESTVPLIKVGF
jgi:hypothetical protein